MATTNITPVSDETKELLDRFANWLFARRGMAASSINLILGYTRRMFDAIGTSPTPDAVNSYIADMRRKKVSFAHLANCLRSMEHFSEFQGKRIHFQRPRRPITTAIKVLSEGKIALIIASARDLRERTMLMLFAYTGIRNNEFINLRVCDIDLGQAAMSIQAGKCEHARIVPLAGECIEILTDYIRERKAQPDDFLFVTRRNGNQLQTQDVRKIIRVSARRAKIKGRIWPHLFRHSLATAMLDRGANIYSIQALLGHTFISTTMDYYLHPSSRNIKADYHRCCPSFV